MIFIPGARRIIVMLDVKFMEDKVYKRSIELPAAEDQSEQPAEVPTIA